MRTVERAAPSGIPAPARLGRLAHWWESWRPSVLPAAIAAAVLVVCAEVIAVLYAGGPGTVVAHPETLLTVWRRYDAVWYLRIASDGYPAHVHDPSERGSFGDATAFPPLFPLAIRGLATVLHLPLLAAALLVSLLTLVPALALFHRLASLDAGRHRGRLALLLLATTPAAFFLVAPYGMGLLLMLVAGALLAARLRHWAIAGVCAGLAAVCKIYAGAVVAAVLVEYMQAHDWSFRRVRADVAWTFMPALLTVGAWAAYLKITFDDPLRFLHAETAWDRHVVAPWTTLWNGLHQVFTLWGHNSIALVRLLEVVSMLLLLGVALDAARRMRRSDAVLAALAFIAISTSGIVDSAHRYLIIVTPVYVSLAMILGRRARLAVVAVSLVLGVFLLGRFVTGAWAG